MNSLLLVLFLINPTSSPNSEELEDPPIIYLLPGQGADCRLFEKIVFPYDTIHLEFPIPGKNTSLREYAIGFIPRINTNRPFILLGVSMGGMICSELADMLSPEKVIILSSSKCRNELPGKYAFQRYIPINKIIPKKVIHWGARFLAPRVEPERRQDSVFVQMLQEKDPVYLKRTVNMIINWDKRICDKNLIHIHGDDDHTIPVRNVQYNYLIPGGTHMMVYIKGKELSDLINQILLE